MSAAALVARLNAPLPVGLPRLPRPDPERMRWALMAISRRLPWRSDCMIQSLAARLWLDAARMPCTFRLGARKGPEGIAAHAWIEVDGKVATGGREVGGFMAFADPGGG